MKRTMQNFRSPSRRVLAIAIAAGVLVVIGAILGPPLLRAPRVVRIDPAAGAQVNPRGSFEILFDQWVRPGSVRDAVRFDPAAEVDVAGSLWRPWGGSTVLVTPRKALDYGVDYRLRIAPGARNLVGRASEPVELAFKTLPYVSVTTVTPSNEESGVRLNAPITVAFDHPVVDPAAIAAAADDPPGPAPMAQPVKIDPDVEGAGRWIAPNVYGFYPAELLPATTYTVIVGPAVTEDGRAQMQRDVRWTFTTGVPELAETRPFDGATDVLPTGEVEVRLARWVDTEAAKPLLTVRHAGSGAAVPGAVEATDGRLLFRPSAPLEHGARYTAELAPGLRSTTGAELSSDPLRWSWTVIGDPTVVEVLPAPDAAEVLTTTRQISVRFSHPIVELTTATDQRTLPQPLTLTPTVPAEGRWIDTSTFVLSPTAGLAPATTYTAVVAAGLEDQTGGMLREERRWSFTTIVPRVVATEPAVDYQHAGPAEPITVIFNQAMDPASLRDAFVLRRVGRDPIAGTLSVTGATATFTPAAPLEAGADYLIEIAPSARAANATATLAAPFDARFRVAPEPRVERSTPAEGEVAQPGTSIQLVFSAPMDWPTVEGRIVVEPALTNVYTYSGMLEISLSAPLEPETDYRVTVKAGARDIFGRTMAKDQLLTFRTASPPPMIALVGGSGGPVGTYNAYAGARVPLRHLGVSAVRWSLHSLEPSEVARLQTNYDAWQNYLPDAARRLREGDLALDSAQNAERLAMIDLGRLDPGLYLLDVRAGGLTDRQVMVVSPYALTLKRSEREVFVWAVDLQSGDPVPGLALRAQTLTLPDPAQGGPPDLADARDLATTGGDGTARGAIAAPEPWAPIFVWSTGERFAFASTGWGDGIGPWDFGLPGSPAAQPLAGTIYTDRPIYRPGQPVYLRGALRLTENDRYAQPRAGMPLNLRVLDAKSNVVLSTTVELSEFGTFHARLDLDRAAPLGGWTANAALVDDPNGPNIFGSFVVAEYRKPAFELTLTPAQADLLRGERLKVGLEARYFAGGSVANAPLRWRLLSEPLPWYSEAEPNYSWAPAQDAYSWYRAEGGPQPFGGRELVAEGIATTDARGNFTFDLPSEGAPGAARRPRGAAEAAEGPRRLFLDVEITDVDGQVIAGQTSVEAHPASFYVGLRPEGYVARVGQPQQVSILTLGWDEKPTGSRAVTVEVMKREWFSAREQGPDGRLYWTSSFTDTLVDTLSARTDAAGRASVAFTPKEGGSYHLRAAARDDNGRTARSSAFTWAYGSDTFWGINDTNRIDMIADKRTYRPGDTARILVPAPYPGMQGLLTVERGTVIEHRLLDLKTSTEVVEVPLTADHAPNVYVSMVLIKPAGGDVPVPELRAGLVNLLVSTEQQELNITVTPDKEIAGPGEAVTYALKTTDASGRGVRAEIGLALVDKAVLSLADDPNPSLRQAFYEKRPLGVITSQSLTLLVDRVLLRLQPGDKGGGGGEAGATDVRRDVPDTAYWNPTVVTDADGSATVAVELPDNLTTWRLDARGITADTRVGQVTHDLQATRPLLIRPALPRFLTAGDSFTLQAVVHNNTDKAVDAHVSVDALGLRIDGTADQSVAVAANATALVRWQAQPSADGETAITFRVSGGGLEDAVEQRIAVQRFRVPEVVASAGQVGAQPLVETIKPPDLNAKGQIELELVPSLASGFETGLHYLETFPYACSEQSVSRFLPNAVTYRLLKQLGRDDPALKAALLRNLASGLQQLYALQHLDGGWGWWETDPSNPYLTAYAVQGLAEARRAGHGVEQAVLDSAIRYLGRALDGGDLDPRKDPSLADARAYVLFVLADAGQPDRGRTIALFDDRSIMQTHGRSYLLMTLHALGGEQERVRTLVGDLQATAIFRTTDAHWEDARKDYRLMSSDVRSTALALQALVRADPTSMLIPNAVRYLMSLRDEGRWATTQESAVTLMALAEYVVASNELEADYSFRAALDEKLLREGKVDRGSVGDAISLTLPLSDLKTGGSQLRLERQGATGKLYYTLRMRYDQDASEVQPLDQGLAVEREYLAVDPVTLTSTGQLLQEAKVGEVVQVRIRLTVNGSTRYLVVEDMLPAGLEALDTSLKTVTSAATGPEMTEADRKDENAYWAVWNEAAIRDNAVAIFATELPSGVYEYTYLARATVPGSYNVLPASAYQMYAPEVFGRTGGGVFVVKGE